MALGRRGWAVVSSVAPPLFCGGAAVSWMSALGPVSSRELLAGFTLFSAAPALGPLSFHGVWVAYELNSWWVLGVMALAIWVPWLWLIFRIYGQRSPGACISLSFLWCVAGAFLGMRAGMGIT